jgi:hypothetical protein
LTYYRDLHYNPSIQLRWFVPLIKAAIETGKEVTTKEPLSLDGLENTITLTPVVAIRDGLITLTLEWRDEEQLYKQRVLILQEESNLKSGSFVYYFLCPYGYKSRQLFYINNGWRSRRSFRHSYSTQNQSHLQRSFNQLPEPYRKYGKKRYRGELTPYGRRCLRFEMKEELLEEALLERAARILLRYKN